MIHTLESNWYSVTTYSHKFNLHFSQSERGSFKKWRWKNYYYIGMFSDTVISRIHVFFVQWLYITHVVHTYLMKKRQRFVDYQNISHSLAHQRRRECVTWKFRELWNIPRHNFKPANDDNKYLVNMLQTMISCKQTYFIILLRCWN